MPNWIRQHVGLASAAGVLVAGGIVAASVAASASSAGPRATSSSPGQATANHTQTHATVSHQYSSVISLHLAQSGFTVPGPDPRPAGPVTFRVTTKVAGGSYFYTARLRGGATVQQVAQWSGEINTPSLPLAAHLAAVHNLYKYVDYTGGVAVYPGRPATVTIDLKPGTYYFNETPAFEDTDAFGTGHRSDAVQTMAAVTAPSLLNSLQVIPSPKSGSARPPHIDGVINLVMSHGQPVFEMPGSLPDNGTFLIRSKINQPAQAIFREVAPGYTDAELQANFNQVLAGGDPPSPLGDSPGGITSISPGNSAIVHLHFPAATYAVLSFLEDPSNGVHRAYEGLHKIVVMH